MSLPIRIARAVALFATATVGLLVAHELDYRLVVPDPAHRHDLLLRTGHGYLSHLAFIALTAGVLAASTSIVLGVARTRGRGRRATTGSVTARLAAVQSGGFVMLEAAERLIVGAPQDDRLLVVTAVGIAVQGLVALLGGLLLVLLDRAGAAIAEALAGAPYAPPAMEAVPGVAPRLEPIPLRPAGACSVRGPPAVSFH